MGITSGLAGQLINIKTTSVVSVPQNETDRRENGIYGYMGKRRGERHQIKKGKEEVKTKVKVSKSQ